MRFLSISTSQKRASLSYFDKALLVFSAEAERDIQPSQWFTPVINMLSSFNNQLIKNLDFIAIDVGPGSFTGIKVGISFVKGLSLPSNIPLVPVNSLESQAILAPDNGKIMVVKNAMRGLYYFAFYEKKDSEVLEIISPRVVSPNLLKNQYSEISDCELYLFTDSITVKEYFPGSTAITNSAPLSEGVGILGLKRYKSGFFKKESEIEPLYLRQPDAVENLKSINK